MNSRIKATYIIGQWKTFFWQIISGFSCGRKETVDIDILATSRNGDRKIIQSIQITSNLPQKQGSATSCTSSDEQLPKKISSQKI